MGSQQGKLLSLRLRLRLPTVLLFVDSSVRLLAPRSSAFSGEAIKLSPTALQSLTTFGRTSVHRAPCTGTSLVNEKCTGTGPPQLAGVDGPRRNRDSVVLVNSQGSGRFKRAGRAAHTR